MNRISLIRSQIFENKTANENKNSIVITDNRTGIV